MSDIILYISACEVKIPEHNLHSLNEPSRITRNYKEYVSRYPKECGSYYMAAISNKIGIGQIRSRTSYSYGVEHTFVKIL